MHVPPESCAEKASSTEEVKNGSTCPLDFSPPPFQNVNQVKKRGEIPAPQTWDLRREKEVVLQSLQLQQQQPMPGALPPAGALPKEEVKVSGDSPAPSAVALAAAPVHREEPSAKRLRLSDPRGLLPAPVVCGALPLAPPPRSTRIYVGNIDYSLGEAEIRQVFAVFGPICGIDMPRDAGRSKGYCFVEFVMFESAELALQAMGNFVLRGRQLRVGWPTSSSSTSPSSSVIGPAAPMASSLNNSTPILAPPSTAALMEQRRIYVGNVPYDFLADDIRLIFQAIGNIGNVHLVANAESPNSHRGYGFVEFSTANEARLAIEIMNGFVVGGKTLRVNYATQTRTGSSSGNSSSPSSSAASGTLLGDFVPTSVTAAAAAAAAAVTRHKQQQQHHPHHY